MHRPLVLVRGIPALAGLAMLAGGWAAGTPAGAVALPSPLASPVLPSVPSAAAGLPISPPPLPTLPVGSAAPGGGAPTPVPAGSPPAGGRPPAPTPVPAPQPSAPGLAGGAAGPAAVPAAVGDTSGRPARAAPATALPPAAGPAGSIAPALVERLFDSPLGPAPPVAGLLLLALSAALALRRRLRQLERDRAIEQAKVGFLKVASHELRTPLTVIRGYVEMAADGSLGEVPARLRAVLPTLGAEVRQLERLVEQMLLAARLDENLLVLERGRFDLRELVQGCRAALPESGDHVFVIDLDTAHVPVRADAGAFGQILGNLVDNAVKYSPAGGDIHIRVERAWNRARLSVSDSGLGIGASDVPLLFTRFGRILTPENSHIFGSGLGLYLVRELTRLHGGQVRMASVPGRGSTFTVELPLDLPPWARLLPVRRGGREARATPAAG